MSIKKLFFLLIAASLLISACGKKVAKRDEVFDAEKFLANADMLISKGEYQEARKLLVEVKNRDKSKKYAPIAHLKIADSYVKEDETEPAIDEYRKFVEFYPDNRFASYSQYQIAMVYFNQIESSDRGSGAAQKALKEFIILKERYPRNPFKDIIELRIEKCRNVIAEGEFIVGEFYFKKGAFNSAINRFKGLINQYPEYRRNDESLLFIGKSYLGLKMNDKAVEYFRMLLDRYPTSRFAPEAKKRSA